MMACFTMVNENIKIIKNKYLDALQPTSLASFPVLEQSGLGVSKIGHRTLAWKNEKLLACHDHFVFRSAWLNAKKMTFLPQQTKKKWKVINEDSSVIATNNHSYSLLKNSEWEACQVEEEELRLCALSGIYNRLSPNRSCLIRHLEGDSQPSTCAVKTTTVQGISFKKNTDTK